MFQSPPSKFGRRTDTEERRLGGSALVNIGTTLSLSLSHLLEAYYVTLLGFFSVLFERIYLFEAAREITGVRFLWFYGWNNVISPFYTRDAVSFHRS